MCDRTTENNQSAIAPTTASPMRSPEMPRPIAPTQDAIAKRNGVLSPPQPLLPCDLLKCPARSPLPKTRSPSETEFYRPHNHFSSAIA
ncbi:hypothetical protein PMG71_16550 [Roseofilum sp. BLCC_M154]|uniref:Uncharacterized protein n=1 Tax=Roseofilum acuticapitatum BLCC-M154 TaxID=3022444 RepID=A0ABT7AVX3_9CYAN|nr:hypothetical protein [Roseofilum acuticapitatum]MDJ1171041.1 hypothetical protein [Roseofilum acuticapitatum BLCC-M154]